MKHLSPLIAAPALFLLACAPDAQSINDQAPNAAPASEDPDQRRVLSLNPQQRDHVLGDMRKLLTSTHGVIEGLAYDDLASVGEAATLAAQRDPNRAGLRMKDALPDEFRMMGAQTRQSFGEIATLAETGASEDEIIAKLAETMNYCTACHSTYQIRSAD